jgi:uncharacterized glyoxalase superfamily protein PhnB
MLPTRTMPGCTVIPEVAYDDVGEAVRWLCHAFGFALRWQAGAHRAQLGVGEDECTVVVRDRPEEGRVGAEPGRDRAAVLVRVLDIDSHCERARRAGALVLAEPTDHHYGERQYAVEDPGGHRWTFSQSIADLAPEEWGGTPARGD